jgi:phthalate 4,5-dioxygenase
MATESMGPIYDRTQEQLGSTDRAISRMRHILISAAKGLAEGKEPSAVAAGLDYRSIRGAEKILEPGEDSRHRRGLRRPRGPRGRLTRSCRPVP